MQRIILEPEQIIVPGECELGDESILKIYFRIFEKGHGEDLPPVIVVSNDIIKPRSRRGRLNEEIRRIKMAENEKRIVSNPYYGGSSYTFAEPVIRNIRERYAKLEEKLGSAPYYLIDGNHRTTAATLTHSPIYALELQTNRDLNEV
ncbi:hypothetical protein HYX12_04000, partial [Candidatus Woesearchaeota archaeon]|nr:hypothetical protein [Candidatus Woesearchaeota archaeon]